MWKDSVSEFDDIESRGQYYSALSDGCTKEEALYYINLRSRDNARGMMDWKEADTQKKEEKSVFHFYKKMTALRKQEPCLIYGKFIPHREYGDEVVAYERNDGFTKFLVLCNFSERIKKIEERGGEILLSNQPVKKKVLKPLQVILFKY